MQAHNPQTADWPSYCHTPTCHQLALTDDQFQLLERTWTIMPNDDIQVKFLWNQTAKQPNRATEKKRLICQTTTNQTSNQITQNVFESSFNDVLKTNDKTAIILNENGIYSVESSDSASQGTQGNMCQILGKI